MPANLPPIAGKGRRAAEITPALLSDESAYEIVTFEDQAAAPRAFTFGLTSEAVPV